MDAEEQARKQAKKALKKEKKRLAAAAAGQSEGETSTTAASTPAISSAVEGNSPSASVENGDEEQKKLDKKKKKEEKKFAKKRKAGDENDNEESVVASTPDIAADQVASNGSTEEKPKKKRKKDVKGAFGNKQKAETNGSTPVDAAAPTNNTNGISKKVTSAATSSTIPSLSQSEIDTFITESALTYEPSTSSTTYPPILDFNHLPVSKGIKDGLKTFAKPTIVQSASWGVQLRPEAGCRPRDCVAIASTGYVFFVRYPIPILKKLIHVCALQFRKNTRFRCTHPSSNSHTRSQIKVHRCSHCRSNP